jgi:uncharacterized membrane protein YhaH (DUF805 family)
MISALVAWLAGRAGRPEYWAGSSVVLALIVLSGLVPVAGIPLLMKLAGVMLWMALAMRRLRDIGWPVWLCATPIVLLVVAVVLVIIGAREEDDLIRTLIYGLLIMSAGGVWLACIVLFGAWNPKRRPATSPEEQAEVFG